MARDYAKSAAKNFSEGTFTASQTGAKGEAARRAEIAANARLLEGINGTQDMEDYIKGGK
jgi:hypothetical protein